MHAKHDIKVSSVLKEVELTAKAEEESCKAEEAGNNRKQNMRKTNQENRKQSPCCKIENKICAKH